MRKTCLVALIALLLAFPIGHVTASGDAEITIEVWHSFAAESKEEATFLAAIDDFEQSHPLISVEVTAIPFGDADQLFLTAAQGGEAPDLVRLSSDQLG